MTLSMRADFSTIAGWIAPGSQVLDLGCGDGSLLTHLRELRGASGYGIDIDDSAIAVKMTLTSEACPSRTAAWVPSVRSHTRITRS